MEQLEPVTPETVSAALRSRAGLTLPPSELRLEQRHGRWIARLPGNILALVADNASAAARLAREAKLLRLLGSRVSFGLPSIQYDGPDLQVRTLVPGAQVGGEGRERDFAARPQAMRLASDLGSALAQLHGALTREEAEEFGSANIDTLPTADALRARLEGKLPEPVTANAFDRLLDLHRAYEPREDDIVLAHGDLWGGNMAVDPDTGALKGLFDLDDAGLADRHVDFMYFHSFSDAFARRALASYAAEGDQFASWEQAAIYHAVAAFAALADIRGKGEHHLLQRRLDWVCDVCHGPIGTTLLGVRPSGNPPPPARGRPDRRHRSTASQRPRNT
jgi:aminoglycoside phosphotransferase (APT) family kinase protein